MPTAIGYFVNPFATGGDASPIPVTTQPSGSISYQEGYSDKYSLNLLTDPTAIPIGRLTMNQLFFEITTQLQQYSQYGVPNFITTEQTGGGPFSYAIYARVRYMGVVYENQVADNTATPGTDTTWLVISGDSTGVIPGTIIDYAGVVVPTGYLACDGSAVSRTDYATLLGVISQTQTCTTTNTSTTITVVDSTQMYPDMSIESANLPSGTTIISITNSTTIVVSAAATASGSVAIRFFNWGNGDGSTTFNVPDLNRATTIGQGGDPATPVNGGGVPYAAVGASGGEETHDMFLNELIGHTHVLNIGDDPGTGPLVSAGDDLVATYTTTSTGGGQPFNVMQPSAVVYKCIKY